MSFVGDFEVNVFDDNTPFTLELDASKHKYPISFKCETYLEKTLVNTTSFSSIYTAAAKGTPSSNILTISPQNDEFNFAVCSGNNVSFIGEPTYNSIPVGTDVSIKTYDHYGVIDPNGENQTPGGIVIKFKSDKALTSIAYHVNSLALLQSQQSPKCSFTPSESARSVTLTITSSSTIEAKGIFEANTEFTMSCPDTVATITYPSTRFAVNAVVLGDNSSKYSTHARRLEMNSSTSNSIKMTMISFLLILSTFSLLVL